MLQEPSNSTQFKIGCISAVAIIIAAIVGLGLPFAERLADRYLPPLTPTSVGVVRTDTNIEPVPTQPKSTSLISINLPQDLSCQPHVSGYCGINITVTWENLDSGSGYYIYTIGHGYYQSEIWWVAGNGIPINTASGKYVISDGAYGNADDNLGVFACLTKTKYSFENQPSIDFSSRPQCEMYSSELSFKPHK